MIKHVLFNCLFVVALAFTLGLTACTMEASEEALSNEIDAPEEYESLSQALVVNDMLPTSGTKTVSIASYPDSETIVYMDSPSSGNWQFKANGSPIGWDGCYTGEHAVRSDRLSAFHQVLKFVVMMQRSSRSRARGSPHFS